MPDADETLSRSLEWLSASPDSASLCEYAECTVWRIAPAASFAVSVSPREYVKYAENIRTGDSNRIVIGPPLSYATFAPDSGGNSNSLSEMPADSTIAPG